MQSLKNYKYDLKGKYERYLKISFIITLLLLIAAFKFSPNTAKTETKEGFIDEVINIENPIQTKQEPQLPDIPKPVVPTIATDENIEDIIFKDVSIDDTKKLSQPPVLEKEKIVEEEIIIFKAVEDKPEMIGGIKSLQSKLYYPEILRRAGIEGEVEVEIIIDEKGNVISAEVVKRANEQLEEIAVKAVRELKFFPGKQRGKAVKVKMTIPISFKLK